MQELNLELKHFTIDRSKWRTGESGEFSTGSGKTQLLNTDGFMCCLGQCLNQVGWDDTLEIEEPDDSGIGECAFVHESGYNTSLSKEAMKINDAEETTTQQKEEALTKLFNDHGLTIEFVGEFEN